MWNIYTSMERFHGHEKYHKHGKLTSVWKKFMSMENFY